MTAPPTRKVVDRELVDRAVDLVWPAIERAAADPAVCGTGCLHVVVADPARPSGTGAAFDEAVLFERSLHRDRWDADYAWYARKKAELSWRTGLDSHEVLARRPHLLVADDLHGWGSVVLDGLVVGVSGAQSWFDEAFATMIAAAVRALAKERVAAPAG